MLVCEQSKDMTERLQRILSRWGIASRRQAETMIQSGRVRLNGCVAQLGQKADPYRDRIEVDGQLVTPQDRPNLVYILLNKPAGVVSTCRDPQGRNTVINLLAPELRVGQGIHPVGRLDTDSTGALLLTNDGELTFRLTHPRHSIAKTYRVWVEGTPSRATLCQWEKGVLLDGRRTRPIHIQVLHEKAGQTCLEMKLQEGRNRQIRRIADWLGHPVLRLHRIAVGSVNLRLPNGSSLRRGAYRYLSDREVQQLKHLASKQPLSVVGSSTVRDQSV